MRKLIVLVAGIAVLGLANYSIYQKEQVLAHGRLVLLELAPVDPRSLMQGDYMALRFRIASEVPGAKDRSGGHLIASVDDSGVAHFRRLDEGSMLQGDEVRIRYRIRAGNQVKLGTNAFFFQEGHAKFYERARYGEARVDKAGEILLTGLRGPDREVLGPR